MADVLDYNIRKDGQVLSNHRFLSSIQQDYESNFMRFANVTDYFIAGHFYGDGAPYLIYYEQMLNLKTSILNWLPIFLVMLMVQWRTTLRASTIADPIYGYNPQTESEVDYKDESAIVVMAVDNLPCELPKDASEGFGELFLENVIPAFFNNDMMEF